MLGPTGGAPLREVTMIDEQLTDEASLPPPGNKAELLERVERARAALEQTIGRMSDAQLVAPGPDGGWPVKDHLAHLAAWEQSLAALLQGRPRHAAMGVDEETYLSAGADGINAMVYQQSKDRSLAEVRVAFGQAHQQVLATLAGLTGADLFKTYSHYQPDEPGRDSGAPIVGWIAGNTYEHFAEHQAWIAALAT